MKLNITKGGQQADLGELFANLDYEPGSLFKSDEHIKAMDKIHSLVCVRERTAKEIRTRLLDTGFDRDVVEGAVASALKCGLIDEERYAAALISGKVHQGWGRAKIMRRLEEDGVDYQTVAKCSQYFATPAEEYERAMRELEKRSVRSKNPRATLTRRLLQKGYSADLTNRAVNDFIGRAC